MDRLEIIKKLNDLERNKIEFENALNDIENYYFECGSIEFYLLTKQFKDERKYNGSRITFNNELIKDYIKNEIDMLNLKIKEKIELLGGDK